MSTEVTKMFSELEKSLMHCLIRDRHPVRNALRRIEKEPLDKQQTQLAKLVSRIEKSQQAVAARSTNPALNYPENLPVCEKRSEILSLISENQVVVIAGETGSGKTTQLPKMCIEAGLGVYGRIGHTQPRRLAARSVSQRIADELNSPLGETVGYQVRFTDQSSDDTRIKVMTDGILLAQTQHDRFLNEYDCIIIDEAHERSLNIDFLMGYLKQLLPKRPDLKVIITSATIDVERFSQHFDDAPVIQVSGRTHPVDVLYRPLVRNDDDEEDRSLFEGIAEALEELRSIDKAKGSPGDTLVFLPGEREIRECAEFLRRQQLPATDILPLYARLSSADQQRIFRPHGGRRVVLSTNVAETSLTVPGIRYVIDSGVARISRYSYRTKVQRLPVEAISQASANQRAGRCGRIEPGTCIRLYDEQDFLSRSEFTDPEIRRTNLAAVILQMLNLRLGDIRKFPFVDAPDDRFVKDGYTLLSELGAVDNAKKITSTGRTMARLPVDPRIGRMLIAAGQRNCATEMMIVAAALTVADPRERPQEKQQAAAEKHKQWADDDSDFATLINLWNGFETQRQELSQSQLRKWCKKNYLSYMRMREWRDIHRQLHLMLRDMDISTNSEPASYDALHKAILSGMLSHIGFRAEHKEYIGARNRRFVMAPGSAGYKKPPKWLVAAELVETSKLFARMVARVEPEWIEECGRDLLKYQYFEPHWQQQRGQVVATEQSSLYGLVVNPKKRVDYSKTHPEESRQILITEALVAQQLKSDVEFYRKNIELIAEVTEYEEKSRRRDL
ncbi:MAG: ATP-dependent RNA helicase HrpA, partial [Pseudomonadota bacterium]|nr:ATP-dependent RNA helicase HrpA [Pseudomonadota bacterium]